METPDRRISERGGHDLTSRQHEVAQRDGLRGERAPDPLVYPAVASADDGHIRPRGHLLDVALCEPPSRRLRKYDPPPRSHLPRRSPVDLLERPCHDVYPYDHPGAATVWRAVAATVLRVVTQVEAAVADDAVLYSPADDPDADGCVHRFREDTENIYVSHLLAFRRTDHDPPPLQIHLRHVFHGKGQIEILPALLFTNHQHFVGGGLEGISHRSEDFICLVHGRKADQVGHVEFSLLGRVELLAVEQELFASQGPRIGPAFYAFEVE